MFRTAHPTDLPGLLRFSVQAVPNFAFPRRRLGDQDNPVPASRALAAPWIPHSGSLHTLLLTQGRRSGGLASVRGYRSISAWEIDYLLLASGSTDTCAELLSRLDGLLLQARGERAFLRLEEDSLAFDAAREAGYRPFLTETLLRIPQDIPHRPSETDTSFVLRFRRPEDDYPLFRLYTMATPVAVRLAEGLTFREWQEASTVRWHGGRWARDFVVLDGDTVVAWTRMALAANRRRALISVLSHPENQEAGKAAFHAAVASVSPAESWLILPEHQVGLASYLAEIRATEAASYMNMVHQIGARIMEPAFIPARV